MRRLYINKDRMIQFFRQNNFFTTLMLIPYTFIVRMACFYLSQPPIEMKTGGVLYSIFEASFAEKPILSNVVINLVIAITAILVNRVVIKHRLSRYQTLIPGLIYIVLVSWLEVFMAFSAIHIANFFLMIGYLSIFKFSKKTSYSIVVFDGSFYFALAALFYTPYIIFLIPAIMGFINLDSFRLRDFFNALIGVLVPFFIVMGLLYFFKGNYNIFDGYAINRNIFTWFNELSFIDLIPLIIYASLIILAIFSYPILVKKTNLQVQKKINILYWFLLASFFCIFLINEKNATNLVILSLPLSLIVGMMAERTKAVFIEEFVQIVIVGAIIYLHFNQSVNILM